MAFGKSFEDSAGFEEGLALVLFEPRHALCEPGPFGFAREFLCGSTFGGQADVDLAPVGRVRPALQHAHLLERAEDRAHRLRTHAFQASQVGGGCGPILCEAFENSRFGP